MAKDKSSPGLPDILSFITSIQEERKKKYQSFKSFKIRKEEDQQNILMK